MAEIWEELSNLEPIPVCIDDVYLDPNNPRLEFPMKEKVSEDRITEDEIQRECLERLRVKDLIDSIMSCGFSTVDRVVLRKVQDEEAKYLVIEGNRRVAALKRLIDRHRRGRYTLPGGIVEGIVKFDVLLYTGDNPDIAWVIQGFRHTPPGIVSWGKYSTAKFITAQYKKGKNPKEIASLLGMGTREVSNFIRSYYAFEQAKSDEEFGDTITPDDFGLFEEVILPVPKIREWLSWDEKGKSFTSEENLRKLLDWKSKGKIEISTATRDTLKKLISEEKYSDLMGEFEESDKLKITEVKEKIEDKEKEERAERVVIRTTADVSESIENLKKISDSLKILPLGEFQKTEEIKKQVLELLKNIIETVESHIKMLKV